MKQLTFILIFCLFLSCSNKNEKSNSSVIPLLYQKNSDSAKTKKISKVKESFLPNFLSEFQLPDSLKFDFSQKIEGDFNGDSKIDFATFVFNVNNNDKGLIILHDSNDRGDYFILGAGKKNKNLGNNINWCDLYSIISKGEVISPTLVDEETGDIIGEDINKKFTLIGDAIHLMVKESDGGEIIFWDGQKYNNYHTE